MPPARAGFPGGHASRPIASLFRSRPVYFKLHEFKIPFVTCASFPFGNAHKSHPIPHAAFAIFYNYHEPNENINIRECEFHAQTGLRLGHRRLIFESTPSVASATQIRFPNRLSRLESEIKLRRIFSSPELAAL